MVIRIKASRSKLSRGPLRAWNMTGIRILTSESNVWRQGAVREMVRWATLIAVFGIVCAKPGFAQATLTSLLVTTDTTLKKASSNETPKPKSSGFAKNQLAHDRVLAAMVEKRFEMKKLFRSRGIAYPAAEIFLRAFKREHSLELWVRPQGQGAWSRVV